MARRPNLDELLADVSLDPEATDETDQTEPAVRLVETPQEEAPNRDETPAGDDTGVPGGLDAASKSASGSQRRKQTPRKSRTAATAKAGSSPELDGAPDRRLDEARPRYEQLEQKHALLWPDQIESLATEARRISRSTRGVEGRERITENTLIRVAVDLLLAQAQDGRLTGATEAELRTSVLEN